VCLGLPVSRHCAPGSACQPVQPPGTVAVAHRSAPSPSLSLSLGPCLQRGATPLAIPHLYASGLKWLSLPSCPPLLFHHSLVFPDRMSSPDTPSTSYPTPMTGALRVTAKIWSRRRCPPCSTVRARPRAIYSKSRRCLTSPLPSSSEL
jgi:hypothetical protein